MLIGEVAQRSGISTRMLRHYDRIGLASPSGRTSGGYRRYSEEDVRRLFHVEGLRSLGLSLHEIADVLDGRGFDPVAMMDQLAARTRARLAREEELLRRLEQVQSSGPAAWSDVLRVIALLRGLDAHSPSVRQRAALSPAEHGDAALLAEAALGEEDPNVAGTLIWALARTGDDAIPVLTEALDSPVAGRRRRAAEALAKIASPRAGAVLAEAFRHSDPVVAARGALARGARGELDAVPALVALVVRGHDDVDAADVLGTLAADHADEIAGAISDALAGASDAARSRLVAALADIPGRSAQELLVARLDDPDRQVALTAASVLRLRASTPGGSGSPTRG